MNRLRTAAVLVVACLCVALAQAQTAPSNPSSSRIAAPAPIIPPAPYRPTPVAPVRAPSVLNPALRPARPGMPAQPDPLARNRLQIDENARRIEVERARTRIQTGQQQLDAQRRTAQMRQAATDSGLVADRERRDYERRERDFQREAQRLQREREQMDAMPLQPAPGGMRP